MPDAEGSENKETQQGESDGNDADKAGGANGGKQSGKRRNKKPLIIVGIVVGVLGTIAFFVWFARRNQVSTDDAYTDGNVVTMAPQVSGYVVALYVNDNMHVKKGDLLVRIDPRDYLTAQAQAQAQLMLAKSQLSSAHDALRIARVQYPAQLAAARAQQQAAAATLAQARRQYSRQHQVDSRATTEENINASTSQQLNSDANLKSANAQVAIASLVPEQIRLSAAAVDERTAQVQQAAAQLAQANLNLGYTEVRSPSDGFITMRSLQLGDYLAVGATMFLIVTPEVWVTANFKERAQLHAQIFACA